MSITQEQAEEIAQGLIDQYAPLTPPSPGGWGGGRLASDSDIHIDSRDETVDLDVYGISNTVCSPLSFDFGELAARNRCAKELCRDMLATFDETTPEDARAMNSFLAGEQTLDARRIDQVSLIKAGYEGLCKLGEQREADETLKLSGIDPDLLEQIGYRELYDIADAVKREAEHHPDRTTGQTPTI